MKPYLTCAKLKVKKSSLHGHGVYAEEDIQSGQIVEECRVLVCQVEDPNFINYQYAFGEKYAILLGYGCLYNHADDPNIKRFHDEEYNISTFIATRFIKQGEELLQSYGENWFSSRNMQTKQSSLWFKVRKLVRSASFLIRFGIIVSVLMLLSQINILSIIKTG
jgi:hypothetical protein